MEYFKTVNGWEEDALLAGTEFPVEIYNVSVGSSASLSRGDLICAGSMSGVFAPVGSASDATKVLMIAADDFVADSLSTVTRAYASGVFSREKIKFGGASLTTDPFEQALRTQNIHLRGLQET
ncbi:MAG: hypothetical protein IJP68_05915 [Selenomonadaceae bacterium]|nr:hypothetical protein [Selenomonadaceae bacterium]